MVISFDYYVFCLRFVHIPNFQYSLKCFVLYIRVVDLLATIFKFYNIAHHFCVFFVHLCLLVLAIIYSMNLAHHVTNLLCEWPCTSQYWWRFSLYFANHFVNFPQVKDKVIILFGYLPLLFVLWIQILGDAIYSMHLLSIFWHFLR